jgi:hypothetical protein
MIIDIGKTTLSDIPVDNVRHVKSYIKHLLMIDEYFSINRLVAI